FKYFPAPFLALDDPSPPCFRNAENGTLVTLKTQYADTKNCLFLVNIPQQFDQHTKQIPAIAERTESELFCC
ncbi:MAG: hypothetical protein EZS28_034589, partial [Streblomastix strix]